MTEDFKHLNNLQRKDLPEEPIAAGDDSAGSMLSIEQAQLLELLAKNPSLKVFSKSAGKMMDGWGFVTFTSPTHVLVQNPKLEIHKTVSIADVLEWQKE